MFTLDISADIRAAKIKVEEERGRIPIKPHNVFFSNYPLKVISERIGLVFENLDIGNYFFANHPRERVGVREIQKFFFFEFILFIIGLTNKAIRKLGKFLITYTSLILLLTFVFKWRSAEQTVFWSLPLFLVMTLGLEKLIFHEGKI